MRDFDLAVIGGGVAGLSVAAVAAQLGLRVALIEGGRMGGASLTGSIPGKALLAAARAAATARQSARLGVRVAPPEIDWEAVQAHVRQTIDEVGLLDQAARHEAFGATVLRDMARFVGPDSLQAGARRLSARRIVIAAGSEAAIPDIEGLANLPFLTPETLFAPGLKPDHLLILGGDPIGLELAQAQADLGGRATVVTADRIALGEDEELADGLRIGLRRRGVTLVEHARVLRVEAGPALVLQDGRRIAGSDLLIAAGRRPRLAALDLAAGNVRASGAGIVTDAGLRSRSNRRVFAVGDIADPQGIGPRRFSHLGGYHAGIVIRRMLFRLPARVDYAALPRVIFTDPELAQVGLTEAEARAAGRSVRVLRMPMGDNDRARTEGRDDGLVKLVVSRHGRVLGIGILAPHASEMIGTWALAILRRVPLSALAGMMLPYPTLAEAATKAAAGFFAPRLFSDFSRRAVRLLNRLP